MTLSKTVFRLSFLNQGPVWALETTETAPGDIKPGFSSSSGMPHWRGSCISGDYSRSHSYVYSHRHRITHCALLICLYMSKAIVGVTVEFFYKPWTKNINEGLSVCGVRLPCLVKAKVNYIFSFISQEVNSAEHDICRNIVQGLWSWPVVLSRLKWSFRAFCFV